MINGNGMAKHNATLSMGVDRAQVRRHVEEVCSKMIEDGREECDTCPFRAYVDAFILASKGE